MIEEIVFICVVTSLGKERQNRKERIFLILTRDEAMPRQELPGARL
jgi:hypothetical protein